MSDEEKTQKLKELWDELGLLRSSMEVDMAKTVNGTKSAGTRLRKGLKLLSLRALDLRKAVLALHKDEA